MESKSFGMSGNLHHFTNQVVRRWLLAGLHPAPMLLLIQPIENLWIDLDHSWICGFLINETTPIVQLPIATKLLREHVEDFTLIPNLDKYILIDVSRYENDQGFRRNGDYAPLIVFRQNGPAAVFQLEDPSHYRPLLSARFPKRCKPHKTGCKRFS